MRHICALITLLTLGQLCWGTFPSYGGGNYGNYYPQNYPYGGNQYFQGGFDPNCPTPGGIPFQGNQQVLPPIDVEVYVPVPVQQPIQQPYYPPYGQQEYCPPGFYRDDLQSDNFDAIRLIDDCESDLYRIYDDCDRQINGYAQRMQRSFGDFEKSARNRQAEVASVVSGPNRDQFLRNAQNRGVNVNTVQACLSQVDGFVRQNSQQNLQRASRCIAEVRNTSQDLVESIKGNINVDRQESLYKNRVNTDSLRGCSKRQGDPCRNERKTIQDTVKGADSGVKKELRTVQTAEQQQKVQIEACNQEMDNANTNLKNNAQNLAQRCLNGARTPF